MNQLRDFNDIGCDPILTIGSSDGGGKTKRFARFGVKVQSATVSSTREEGVFMHGR
jgi:hypothetical protein